MRLIDADALRQKIERWKNESNQGSSFSDSVEGFAYDEVLCAIDVAPTVKLRELWTNVNDALPQEDGLYLAYYKWLDVTGAWYTFCGVCGFHNGDWVDLDRTVTHWMPLPQYPKN